MQDKSSSQLLHAPTPIIFADGTKLYKKLSLQYTTHKSGLFILAPSGSGKTYFIDNQSVKDWIDGDVLWPLAGADYTSSDWGDSEGEIEDINIRSYVITREAKKLGFWVIGSSNYFLKPDAIVIPDWQQHITYITKRQKNVETFDGGATMNDIDGVKEHIKWITGKWSKEEVPYFTDIASAATYLAKRYN